MNKRLAFAVLVVLVLSCIAAGSGPKQSNMDLPSREFEAWNSHDPDKVVGFFTPDVDYEDVAFGLTAHGSAELRKMAAGFFTSVPDMKLELVSSTIDGNHGSVEWVFSGTDVGLFKTGKKFSVRGASRFELKGNKFSRSKDFYDAATIMRQVGVLPAAQ